MIEREQAGITPYYRTLPSGNEVACGMHIELSRVSPEEAFEVITSEGSKPGARIAQFLDGDSTPYELIYDNLGKNPNERKSSLRDAAKAMIEWCEKIIILHQWSTGDIKPRSSGRKKYFLLPGEKSITEVFAIQKLSKKEFKRFLEKQFKDSGSKTITIQNDWDITTIHSIDSADEELIELIGRSEYTTIQHNVIQDGLTK